jgi:hypothetical protein
MRIGKRNSTFTVSFATTRPYARSALQSYRRVRIDIAAQIQRCSTHILRWTTRGPPPEAISIGPLSGKLALSPQSPNRPGMTLAV